MEAAVERHRWGPFAAGDLAERAALLLRGICLDHPFEDGNQRTGFAAAFAFLDTNDDVLLLSNLEIEAFMLAVARGTFELEEMAAWIRGRLANV